LPSCAPLIWMSIGSEISRKGSISFVKNNG